MTKWSGFCRPRYQAGSYSERCVKTRVCPCNVQPNYCYVTILRRRPGPGQHTQHSSSSGLNHYLRRFCDYLHFIASNDRAGEWEHYVKWLCRGTVCLPAYNTLQSSWCLIRIRPHIELCVHLQWHAARLRTHETGTGSQINLDNVVQSKVCDSYTTPATDL